MKRSLLLLATSLTLILSGCGSIRDASVYSTEIQFSDMTVRRAAPSVRHFLMTSCTCSESVAWTATGSDVTTEQCESAADWYRTYVGRWAWHIAMVRYNGSVEGAVDPGPVPQITTSCDLPEHPVEITSGGAL